MINIFLLFVVGALLINVFLSFRSKTHSNKFIEKIIVKFPFKYFLRTTMQGWHITTLKTISKLVNFEDLNLSKSKWLSLKDKKCSGVADPFLIKEGNIFYLFFEYEYHKHLKRGADLAYAISNDGISWEFKSLIIKEPFHQSFPYVFLKDNKYYMLPESYESNEVRLYVAKEFPDIWELDTVLFEGMHLVDTIFLEVDEIYFWFTTDIDTNHLLLYYSYGFKGKWKLHPSSPISIDLRNNRNAGAIITENGVNYRVAQDGVKGYGSGINLYEIVSIDINTYIEKPIKEPLFFKDFGVKKDGIHHLSILHIGKEKLIALDAANFAVNGLKFK